MRDALFAEFEPLLGLWLASTEPQAARLVLRAQADGCPCGADLGLPGDTWTACLAAAPCRLQEEGQLLALAGAGTGRSPRLLCLRYPVGDGAACVLQVEFAGGLADRQKAAECARSAAPLLMWAKTLLEKRTSESSLQAEIQHAITAQEEEREWIALEVHDRVAQTMASVFQQLQALEGLARLLPEVRQAAVRGSLLCREAIQEARNIMNDLRPPVLEDLGLVPALEEDLRQLAEQVPCKVKQTLTLAERPPRGIELTLYRVFREAVVNIQRHAQATEVEVVLQNDGMGLRLEISDNGSGFDVQDATRRKRVGGLLSMRRRAEVVGGAWWVESELGRGTSVTVWLPLSAPGEGAGSPRD